MDTRRNNGVVLHNIQTTKSENVWKVIYNYSAPEDFMQYVVDKEESLFIEFPANRNEKIPEAVLAIPFVGIILTVAMILDIPVHIEEIDKVFYKSIPHVEQVFQSMYHTDKICMKVHANRTVECNYKPLSRKSLFFTGGVDATSALVSTISEKPLLVNIWGGDIRLDDKNSHQALDDYFNELCFSLGLQYFFIRTNAREYFKENKLCGVCLKILGRKYYHDWWASIAHILSMTTTISPFIYANKIQEHYIGSSYEIGANTFDSNNSQIVDAIKYCSCKLSILDEQIDRNEKVKRIIKYEKDYFSKENKASPFKLKVCWFRKSGENCCSCEKCYRTIMNIIVNHGDPNKLGFTVNRITLENIKRYILTKKVNRAFWIEIQREFIKEKDYWSNVKEVSWILYIKINACRVYFKRLMEIVNCLLHKHNVQNIS